MPVNNRRRAASTRPGGRRRAVPSGGGTARPGTTAGGGTGSAGAGSGVRRALGMVLLLFTTEAVFQTLLPVGMDAAGVGSGLLIGVFIAVSQGAGLFTASPVAAVADHRGRGRVLVVCGLALAASLTGLGAASLGGSAWLWAVPVVGYGLARGATVIITLGVIARSGEPYRTQGLNAATQRLASVLGALLTAVFIMWQGWAAGFWLMAVLVLVFVWLARGVSGRADRDPDAAVPAGEGFAVTLRMLRAERALQASSLINLMINTLVVLGNAFYPLALDVPTAELARWLLVVLLCRDLTSVAAGPLFGILAARIGLRGVIALSGACTVSGLVVVGISGSNAPGVVTGAVLHGIAVSMGNGSTNILATASGTGGTALRLTATNHINFIGSMALPISFGLVLDLVGPRSVFLSGAGVTLLLAVGVLILVRPVPGDRPGDGGRAGDRPGTRGRRGSGRGDGGRAGDRPRPGDGGRAGTQGTCPPGGGGRPGAGTEQAGAGQAREEPAGTESGPC